MHDSNAEPALGFPALSIAEAHARLTAPGARFELQRVVIRGVPTRVWKNAPDSLREVFARLEELLEHPERARYDVSSLESISMGGAPAAKVLASRLHATFPRARAANGWGMTEVTSSFASNQAEDYLARPDSCGLAAPCNEWKIMNEDGSAQLPLGEIGELWVKGPQVVRGYWNDPEATRESFVDGWLKTGDIAYLDKEGFCYLVDRAKDMLIRGGENIYCVEVENVLHDHPAVLDVAVVGLAHEQLGEVPAAVVQLRPKVAADDATAAVLRAHARAQLASFKVPAQLHFTHEQLPRNAAGKLLKAELRSWFDDPAHQQAGWQDDAKPR